MTTSTTVTKTSGLTVINLKVTKEGNIERKMTDVSPQAQLNNTLLEALCPGIRVASVTVTPEPLDQVERARVESALSRFNVEGIDYRLIGASGSAKTGKYYAVDARFERPLAARRFSTAIGIDRRDARLRRTARGLARPEQAWRCNDACNKEGPPDQGPRSRRKSVGQRSRR